MRVARANRRLASRGWNRFRADYPHSVEKGQSLDRSELIAAHPDLADDLQSFFCNHDSMDRLALPLTAAFDAPSLVSMTCRFRKQIS